MNQAQMNERLLEAFARTGLLEGGRRDEVVGLMQDRGLSLEMALYQVEAPSRTQLAAVLEEVTGTTCLDPALMHLSEQFIGTALDLFPAEVLVALRAFPVQMDGNRLHVAMVNPTDKALLRRLEGLCGMRVVGHVAPERGIADVLESHCGDAIRERRHRDDPDPEALVDDIASQLLAADIEPVVERALRRFARVSQELDIAGEEAYTQVARDVATVALLHRVLNRLVIDGASDMHFEPQESGLRLRARIDGVLATRWSWPAYAIRPVLARLKLMSGLSPMPAHEPLDSHIEYGVIYGREVEFRVSTLPSLFGEKAVLRVLDRSKGDVAFQQLGFETDVYEVAQRNFNSPTGLILVTGPTGSGKTTTLYSALELINDDGVNVVTAEDPIESKIAGATQVNCGEDGISFAAALRSFLRQDPDVIMVGEIRDEETATIALRAALTGHLVLSTLHTNDASSTIMRLTNMGLEPFLVGAALRMVIAQRLVRRLCGECRKPVEPDTGTVEAMTRLGIDVPEVIYEPGGCDRCHGTGYKGRSGLYEVLDVDERIETLIVEEAPPEQIRHAAEEAGSRSVFADGLLKIAAGRTSLAEVHRVVAEG